MANKQLENWIIKHPRFTFGVLMPIAAMLVLSILISCDMRAERRAAEEQARKAQQDAEYEAERQEIMARRQAEQEAEAERKGLTFEEYKETDKLVESKLWLACRKLVEANAPWGVNWNFVAEFEWAKNKDTKEVIVWGHDLKIKNAFNAERQASYACEYNPKTEALRLRKLE